MYEEVRQVQRQSRLWKSWCRGFLYTIVWCLRCSSDEATCKKSTNLGDWYMHTALRLVSLYLGWKSV